MPTKDDQVGNKTANKDGKEGKKRAREKDRNRFAKKKGRYFGFLQNSFLAILILISRKLVQRREIGEKCSFFATRWPSPKG